MPESFVYLDNAAATPVFPEVVEAMKLVITGVFGNPSSIHGVGVQAANLIEQSQKSIAQFLNCQPKELFFTSGGTEGNNLAILGTAKAARNRGNHIVTTNIEHPSVLNACRSLEKDGFEITYLPVGKDGLVDLRQLQESLKKETILITVHLANSELGVIQPIEKISQLAKAGDIYLHSDACQATAYMDIDVNKLGVDLLTLNASKAYGPKGVGVLYVKENVEIFPLIFGGGQQQGLRSGTENVPGIVGLATAINVISSKRAKSVKQILKLRDMLQLELEQIGAKINVKTSPRLPNHLSAIMLPIGQNDLVAYFDKRGIAVSSGSACSSRSLNDSHVLTAIGLSSAEINKTIRISLGYQTTKQDIDNFLKAI